MIGAGGMDVSVAATGNNFTTAETVAFSFSTPVRKCVVSNNPSSGVTLLVLFNSVSASTTAWDFCLQPGQSVVFPNSPGELTVSELSIYSSGAATLGSDFSIRGWV